MCTIYVETNFLNKIKYLMWIYFWATHVLLHNPTYRRLFEEANAALSAAGGGVM